MDRYCVGALIALMILSSCACALSDEDRDAGKPSVWYCILAGVIKGKACDNSKATDPTQCKGVQQ